MTEPENNPLSTRRSAIKTIAGASVLAGISLPCTILVGSKDKTTPPFHTDALHAGIAGSRLVRVPGAGHTVNWEAADVIVAEIEALAGRG